MATNGKITMKGATIGASIGAVLGGLTEGIVHLTEKGLKAGAAATKKGIHEGRELLSKGLEKTGETLSDEGIAKRKVQKAEKTIARAAALKAQYAAPQKPQATTATNTETKSEPEIVNGVPAGAITVSNGEL